MDSMKNDYRETRFDSGTKERENASGHHRNDGATLFNDKLTKSE